jgi:MFS family permease
MILLEKATPLYLSEIAPPKWRGAFNTGFEFFIGIGVVVANCINYVHQDSFLTIFERQYRPQLIMAFAIPFFQQLTGINIVAFYAPNLFQSVGLGNNGALLSAIILGVVNLASILVSTAFVDRFGRRFLFILGGTLMLICLVSKLSKLYKNYIIY